MLHDQVGSGSRTSDSSESFVNRSLSFVLVSSTTIRHLFMDATIEDVPLCIPKLPKELSGALEMPNPDDVITFLVSDHKACISAFATGAVNLVDVQIDHINPFSLQGHPPVEKKNADHSLVLCQSSESSWSEECNGFSRCTLAVTASRTACKSPTETKTVSERNADQTEIGGHRLQTIVSRERKRPHLLSRL